MRSRFGKVGLVFLVLVLALGGIGAAYSMWFDKLHIEGDVNTGEVEGYWSACYCTDLGLDPEPGIGAPPKDKDVGSTVCTLDLEDSSILYITVSNAYPSYFVDCEVEFYNAGTIPVKVQSITITPDNFTLASAYGANDGHVWVDVVDGIGLQMEPGEATAQSFKLHLEQMAAQDATYTFSVEIKVVQWNEYQP